MKQNKEDNFIKYVTKIDGKFAALVCSMDSKKMYVTREEKEIIKLLDRKIKSLEKDLNDIKEIKNNIINK